MPAPSMAVMALGKLMVVTRLVATGTAMDTFSSRKSFKISLDGCASATVAVSNNRLTIDFIFEVSYCGWEASVQGHVGVADEAQPERERKRLVERLVLKNAAADDLAGDSGQHLVVARRQNVNARNLGLLVQLFGAKLGHLFDALVLRLAQRRFEEQQFEQIGIVEILRIAFEERHRFEFGLLAVQIFGRWKLEQRTQIICSGGVNDDDALALFELGDNVVAVNRRQQQHGDGEEKPEPRKPVALDQKPCRIK